MRQLIKILKRAVYLDLPIAELVAQEKQLLGGLEQGAAAAGLWPRLREDVRPIRQVRNRYAARALELNDGNWTATARQLDVAVNTLRAYLEQG